MQQTTDEIRQFAHQIIRLIIRRNTIIHVEISPPVKKKKTKFTKILVRRVVYAAIVKCLDMERIPSLCQRTTS